MSRPAGGASTRHDRPYRAIEVPQDTRCMPSANVASGGSRLTTRNDSRGKSKKYPGCTSTPSVPAGETTRSSSGRATAPAAPRTSRRRRRSTDRQGHGVDRGTQSLVVRAHARVDLLRDRRRRARAVGRRGLHRRRHREIGVADELEPRERVCTTSVRTAAGGDPAELHLRQADRLRQSSRARTSARPARERTDRAGRSLV